MEFESHCTVSLLRNGWRVVDTGTSDLECFPSKTTLLVTDGLLA